jgi:hypothetical protein
MIIQKEARMYSQADCVKEYGSQYNIGKLMDDGKLFKVERGIYSEEKHVPTLAVLMFKYPKAVATMKTALYIHGLTDAIPEIYDLATDRDAAKIKDKRVKQYFYPSDMFEEGIEKKEYMGYKIRVYSKERMLVELIRYKSKLPFDFYKEVILNYRRVMPTLNIQAIQDYAMESPKSARIIEILQTEVL